MQPPSVGELSSRIAGEGDAQALIDSQDRLGGGETILAVGLEHIFQGCLLEQQERLSRIVDPQVQSIASSTQLVRIR